MKAYQLKVLIRGSHPPIWRRVIVPAGLTFSQLTIVLNEVMGWSGYHMSEYTFRKVGVELCDDFEEDDRDGWNEYEVLDAKDYKIDELFDKADKFVYTYDFGDYWEHDVTIEKTLEEYEHNYPEVIKYKGETPLEDCGGIDGWYDMQGVLADPDNARYQEIKEWIDEQHREPFDMELKNQGLEDLELTDKESEPKTRADLYEDFFEGKPFYTIITPEHDEISKEDILHKRTERLREQVDALFREHEKLEEKILIRAYRESGKSLEEVIQFLSGK